MDYILFIIGISSFRLQLSHHCTYLHLQRLAYKKPIKLKQEALRIRFLKFFVLFKF